MAEKRKRKIDDECRQFKEEWKLKYFIRSGEKALFVICSETGCDERIQYASSYCVKANTKRNMHSWRVKSVLKVFLNYKINSRLKGHCSVN